MELLKKSFNFSDTISGTTFLIRWVISNIIQFPGGLIIGSGIGSGIMGVTMIGLIIASAGLFLQFSTLMKRSRALFPGGGMKYMYFYLLYVAISILQGFTTDMPLWIGFPIALVMVVIFLYTTFSDSTISKEDHIG